MKIFKNKYKSTKLVGIELPKHVAIIMDGNGRWAKKRKMPRSFGHRVGVEVLRSVITMSSNIGIKVLTLYAFSTENWARPEDEVGVLMNLLVEFLTKEIKELHENNINIRFMGDVEKFPKKCRDAIKDAIELTKDNTGLVVNIALNYGGRTELLRAFHNMMDDIQNGELQKADVTEDTISEYLYTKGLPDPDIIIRTSGEMRLSNFMLYQGSYAELYIPETLWPDFKEKEYEKALLEYASRKRRFGKI
ncbi:MAG: isoprenyl transferase [Clostridiales bacterium]|nr:isoprenyl transferase [Clostridiales bacterium]